MKESNFITIVFRVQCCGNVYVVSIDKKTTNGILISFPFVSFKLYLLKHDTLHPWPVLTFSLLYVVKKFQITNIK